MTVEVGDEILLRCKVTHVEPDGVWLLRPFGKVAFGLTRDQFEEATRQSEVGVAEIANEVD